MNFNLYSKFTNIHDYIISKKTHSHWDALTLTAAVKSIANTGSNIPHLVTVSNDNVVLVLVVDSNVTIY